MPVDATGLTLLIPARADEERDAVAEAFQRAGGDVIRLDRFWEPLALDARAVRVYGNDTFCLVLAQILGLSLTSPPDDLVMALGEHWLGRKLSVETLAGCEGWSYPLFVKPLVPKVFTARVYRSAGDLLGECRDLPEETPVVVSEVVAFVAEARAFVLGGVVLDCAVYEGQESAEAARGFAAALAGAVALPRALVLDVGCVESGRWVFIESNAAWGAGLNGCDAGAVLPSIVAASSPLL